MQYLHILKQLLQNVIQINFNSLFLLDLHKTQLSHTEHPVTKKTQEVLNNADFSPWLQKQEEHSEGQQSPHVFTKCIKNYLEKPDVKCWVDQYHKELFYQNRQNQRYQRYDRGQIAPESCVLLCNLLMKKTLNKQKTPAQDITSTNTTNTSYFRFFWKIRGQTQRRFLRYCLFLYSSNHSYSLVMLLVTKHLPPGSTLSLSQRRQIMQLSRGQLAVLAELSSGSQLVCPHSSVLLSCRMPLLNLELLFSTDFSGSLIHQSKQTSTENSKSGYSELQGLFFAAVQRSLIF